MIPIETKVRVYEALFHQIQLFSAVAMNPAEMQKIIGLIDSWSYAHRRGNGEYNEDEQQALVDAAFGRMAEYVGVKIA
jgi:hypothetical protein